MIQNDVLAKFKEIFGDEGDIRVYFAPGRVNLIGEHTDYNGGHVFPCALTIGTYMAARKRTDRKLCFYSMNFNELGVIESSLDAFTPDPDGLWTNYPMGVMWAFEGRGMKLETGLDIALFGNIPNGSGLSSSASLEVVTGYMLKDLYGFDVTNQDLALIGQYSENNYNEEFGIDMDALVEAFLVDDLTHHYSENTVREFCAPNGVGESLLEAKVLSNKRTMVRLSKATDLNRRKTIAAIMMARAKKDPLYNKLVKYQLLRKQTRAKIVEKYGNRAARAAMVAQKQYMKNMRGVNLTNTSFITDYPNR